MAGYSVTFSVVDNATKQIDAINRRLAAMRAPMERMSHTINRFVDLSGLKKVAEGFEWIGKAAFNVLRTLSAIVPVMGTLIGAASIAGIARLVQGFASWSHELQATADGIGISTAQLQKFETATRLAGGSASDMDGALSSLHTTMADIAVGRGGVDAIQWLNRFHINVCDANRQLRSTAEIMPEVIAAINGLKEPADRTRASAALLGATGDKLTETFRQSTDNFPGWMSKADRYAALTAKQNDAFQRFEEAQGRIGTAFDTLGAKLGAMLADKFTPFINRFSEFVEKQTPQIIAAVGQIADKFAAWIDCINWPKVQAGVQSVVDALGWAVTHLDEIAKGAEIVAGIFAAKWAIGIVGSIASVVTALGAVGGGAAARAAAGGGGTGLLGALGSVALLGAAAYAAIVATGGTKPMALSDMTVGDPRWGVIPRAEQLQYPNSPASQETAPSPAPPAHWYNPGSWFGRGGLLGVLGADGRATSPVQPLGMPTPPGGGGTGGTSTPGTPPVFPGGTSSPAPGQAANPAQLRDAVAATLNVPSADAAAIVSNMYAESGLRSGINEAAPIVPGSRGGFGLVQWTGPRRRALEEYAVAHNLDVGQQSTQLAFMKEELKKYPGLLARMQAARTPEEKAAIFFRGYESGDDPSLEAVLGKHIAHAAAFAALPSPAAPAAPAAPAGGTAPAMPAAPTLPAVPPVPAAPPVAAAPPIVIPPATGSINGAVDVSITHRNPPPNTSVTASGTGAVNVAPPTVAAQNLGAP